MSKEAGKCPKCGRVLFENSKKVVDIYGVVNYKQEVVDTKVVYHCPDCGKDISEYDIIGVSKNA